MMLSWSLAYVVAAMDYHEMPAPEQEVPDSVLHHQQDVKQWTQEFWNNPLLQSVYGIESRFKDYELVDSEKFMVMLEGFGNYIDEIFARREKQSYQS